VKPVQFCHCHRIAGFKTPQNVGGHLFINANELYSETGQHVQNYSKSTHVLTTQVGYIHRFTYIIGDTHKADMNKNMKQCLSSLPMDYWLKFTISLD